MWAAWAFDPSFSKWVVVVDEDIDLRLLQVLWAMSWHVQPEREPLRQPRYCGRGARSLGRRGGREPARAKDRAVVQGGRRRDAKTCLPRPLRAAREDLDRVDAQWADYGLE